MTGDVVIVERRVAGEPLLSRPPLPELPSTKLMKVIKDMPRHHSPGDRTVWPHVPDPEPVVIAQIRVGYVAWVRTNMGVRKWLVRLVTISHERRNRGRHFLVGMDRQGWCHSEWLDRVIRVEPLTKALSAGPRRKELTTGSVR